jgi:hypothetical protein
MLAVSWGISIKLPVVLAKENISLALEGVKHRYYSRVHRAMPSSTIAHICNASVVEMQSAGFFPLLRSTV